MKTPERAAKALAFLTQGQGQADILRSALFEEDCEEMVLIRDIEVFSLCEHHMLPFFGKPMWPTCRKAASRASARFRGWSTSLPAGCGSGSA